MGDGRVAAGDGVGSGVRTTASGDEPGVGGVDAAGAAAAPHPASSEAASTVTTRLARFGGILRAFTSSPLRAAAAPLSGRRVRPLVDDLAVLELEDREHRERGPAGIEPMEDRDDVALPDRG